mgnify:CR=1 FL=1
MARRFKYLDAKLVNFAETTISETDAESRFEAAIQDYFVHGHKGRDGPFYADQAHMKARINEDRRNGKTAKFEIMSSRDPITNKKQWFTLQKPNKESTSKDPIKKPIIFWTEWWDELRKLRLDPKGKDKSLSTFVRDAAAYSRSFCQKFLRSNAHILYHDNVNIIRNTRILSFAYAFQFRYGIGKHIGKSNRYSLHIFRFNP